MALTHFWKLDDNAASTTVVATTGTNGTLEGGDNTSVKYQASGPGTAITASMLLNGIDDAVDVSGASISFAAGTNWTVSLFVKFTSVGGNYGLWGTSGSTLNRLVMLSGGGGIRFNGGPGTGSYDFTVSLSTGTWYHIAATHTAGNSMRLYVNGTESSTGALTVAESFAPNRIGKQNAVFASAAFAWAKVFNTVESVATLYAERNLSGGPFPHFTRRAMSGGLITMGGGVF